VGSTAALLGVLMICACADEHAMARLRIASMRSTGLPQPVLRFEFSEPQLSRSKLKDLKSDALGSTVLRDAMIASATVREFVQTHGIPDGVAITARGLQLELMYADTSVGYVFELHEIGPARLIRLHPLSYTDETDIKPEAYWERAANDLQTRLEDTGRLLRIGRRLLSSVVGTGVPTRDFGFLVIEASPVGARVFGLSPDSRGVIVAYVDPQGPASADLRVGDLIVAVGGRPISGAADYQISLGAVSDQAEVTRQRADSTSVVEIRPELLPFAIDLELFGDYDINAWTAPGVAIITKGLMSICDDDELAFAIGHELGHLAEKQSGSQKERDAMRKGGMAPGVIAMEDREQLVARVLKFVRFRDLFAGSAFRQEQELLADRHGIEYAVHAGFDPAGALRLLEKLRQRENAIPAAEFIRTHPPATERIEQARRLIAQFSSVDRT
jgi:hypothetical protein